jgi:hypothetical protein
MPVPRSVRSNDKPCIGASVAVHGVTFTRLMIRVCPTACMRTVKEDSKQVSLSSNAKDVVISVFYFTCTERVSERVTRH